MTRPRLTIELVPRTCFWSNVRSNVSAADWEKCKAYAREKSGGVCSICGQTGKQQGRKHNVEAHEIWEYDEDERVQRLVDIVALCPRCHQCKHLGRSQMVMNEHQYRSLVNHFRSVNEWSVERTQTYFTLVFQVWALRSEMKWRLDVSFLKELGLEVEVTDRGAPVPARRSRHRGLAS